ncbi:MAG TPA: PAS domain-containing protein, partial [Gemmataceae bacterium]|nr:PAS domain-containing protein [Gemmataceae bacterium]
MPQPRPSIEQELARLQARVAELERQQEAHERDVRQHVARQEEQARILRSMLDSMADGLAVADENGQFLLFNPAAERILGIGPVAAGPEEWSRFYGLFLPDTVTPYPADQLPLARAMRGEAVDAAEVFVRNPRLPDGVWLSV